MSRTYRTLLAIGILLLSGAAALAQTTQPTTAPAGKYPAAARVLLDLAYVPNGHERQKLDLILPPNPNGKPLPVVVFLHGGGWNAGGKADSLANGLVEHGYAVANVNYRYSRHAIFPAQIHDCAAAVRWLRGNAQDYGLDKDHIAAWGASAGGNLALLLGVGADVKALAGEEGEFDAESSRVNCVVDFFGTVEFRKPDEFPWNKNRIAYLGGEPGSKPELAALATPITHVSGDDAPVIIFHGDADRTVSNSHSEALAAALREAGVEVEFHTIAGAGHGGEKFRTPEVDSAILRFLDRHLK